MRASTPPPCPVCASEGTLPFAVVGGTPYFRCSLCHAVAMEPARRLPAGAERARYLLHRNRPDDTDYLAWQDRLLAPLLARLPPAARGLDFGSGPSPVLAARLEAAGHPTRLYDPFFHPDATALEGEGRYDFIVVCEVAEHLHRPAEEFARLVGMIAPGGILAVMTAFLPDGGPPAFAAWHYRSDPTHVVFYGERTFRVIAARHGLAVDFPGPNLAFLAEPERDGA